MTAFCIITTEHEVVVATDGGSFRPDGSLCVIAGKVILVPEASAVITGRGPIYTLDELTLFVHASTARLDFDTLLEIVPLFVDRAAAKHAKPSGEPAERFEFCLAGWSESRQAHEAWRICSYDAGGVAAGTVHRLPECHLSNVIPSGTAANFGLLMPETGARQWRQEPFRWAALALSALRFCPSSDPGLDHGAIAVGAFVQVTRISRHAVASEVIQEWPDAIGRRIDPEESLEHLRGEALRRGIFGNFDRWSDDHAH